MDSGDQTKHLLNIWPGQVTPLPRALAGDVSLQGEWVELAGHWSEPRTAVDLPPELYLRGLRELDLADPAALFEFTLAYGVLAHADWRGLGNIARRMLIGLGAVPWVRVGFLVDLAETVRVEVARRTGQPFTVDALERRRFFHLSEVRMHAAALRDMVRLRQVVEGAMTYEAAVREWECGLALGAPMLLPDASQPAPAEAALVELAAHDLVLSLNAGLHEFTLRAIYGERGRGLPYVYVPPAASTYGVLCLQFANHIAEGATYRNCRACGRWFVRKDDPRYTVGSKRLHGKVEYCSDTCANRVAKRDQLARKRAKREREESSSG